MAQLQLFELKQQHARELERADAIIKAAENAGRALTQAEEMDVDSSMLVIKSLARQIEAKEKINTISKMLDSRGRLLPGGPGQPNAKPGQKVLSPEYMEAFGTYVRSNGKNVPPVMQEHLDIVGGGFLIPSLRAASYEGGVSTGAAIVPTVTEQLVVPLASPEISIRKLAMVLPTSYDLKLPRKTALGTAAFKAESGASSNFFGGSDPNLDNFTLSAFMLGHLLDASWELLQDVQIFQTFLVEDGLNSIALLEESKFLAGSGTGEPEGLLGNVGTGVTGVAAGSDTYATELLQATFDVQAKLNAIYHPGAAWVLSRATSVVLRKAQSAANLYYPIWTRVGSQDFLHGYPVEYATGMPAIGSGNTPILFGDFKAGYVIGDRGGSGVNVKILDQPKAVQGVLEILCYRRVDGRVRRSEAIQAITLA